VELNIDSTFYTFIKEWTVIIFGLGKTIFPRRNAKHDQTFTYLLDIHVESILNGK
jgi:hypothetical protein